MSDVNNVNIAGEANASLEVQDLTYTAIEPGLDGNSITIANTAAVAAELEVQDITYTAAEVGSAGNDITITYTGGATAGAEVVSVTGTDISIQIEDGVSTATQVKAAFDAKAEAVALASATITGTAGDAQVTATETPLAGGTGIAGDAEVVVVGTDIEIIIESGVTTATKIFDAVSASEDASALVTCEVTGTGSDAQDVAVSDNLAGGVGWQEIVDVSDHNYTSDFMIVQASDTTRFKLALTTPSDTETPDFTVGVTTEVELNGSAPILYARAASNSDVTATVEWDRETTFTAELGATFSEIADFGNHSQTFRTLQILNPEAEACDFSFDGVNTAFSMEAGDTSLQTTAYLLRGKLYAKSAATPAIEVNTW